MQLLKRGGTRKYGALTASVAALIALGLTPSAQAAPTAPTAGVSQQAALLECPGYETATYEPGLTLAPRQVALSASGAIGPCVGLPLDHTNGTISFTGNGSLSCTGGSSTGNGRINWTNPQSSSSTFDFTAGVGLRPGGVSVLVLTGEIKSGDFKDSTIIFEIVLVPGVSQTLECLTPQGLTTSSGLVNLQIL
ncbi:hypothetical protein AB0M38_34885 [Streptomyces sp. NPDC051742]|uniref:hypothetical protein n=1 Tax=unclassified Streptomyces TaxID=2593676 RepID=UPI003444F2AF